VDLATGAARPLAQYNASTGYSGLAIPTQPVAYSVADTELRIFNPTDSSPVIGKPVVGLGARDYLHSVDFRPATGQLYALVRNIDTTRNPVPRLYTIDLGTGQATLVGPLGIAVRDPSDIDFNPVTDQLLLTTLNDDTYWVDPTTGSATLITRFTGLVIASDAAYDNNVAGTSTSNLYLLGTRFNTLYRATSPITSVLTPIGRFQEPGTLNVNTSGFDIGGTSNVAYVRYTPVLSSTPTSLIYGPPRFATINLSTGQTTIVRELAGEASRNFTIGLGF
jgi:hypothetical protein